MSSSAVNITPRLIYMEDLASTQGPGQTFSVSVLGVGPTSLTGIPILLLSQLASAANDEAAATAGVLVGQAYFNTTHTALWTRMS